MFLVMNAENFHFIDRPAFSAGRDRGLEDGNPLLVFTDAGANEGDPHLVEKNRGDSLVGKPPEPFLDVADVLLRDAENVRQLLPGHMKLPAKSDEGFRHGAPRSGVEQTAGHGAAFDTTNTSFRSIGSIVRELVERHRPSALPARDIGMLVDDGLRDMAKESQGEQKQPAGDDDAGAKHQDQRAHGCHLPCPTEPNPPAPHESRGKVGTVFRLVRFLLYRKRMF